MRLSVRHAGVEFDSVMKCVTYTRINESRSKETQFSFKGDFGEVKTVGIYSGKKSALDDSSAHTKCC